jgi:hypothetical protein
MDDYESRCPACGEFASYCQGHGEIGDAEGFDILQRHDADDHEDCHPFGCEVRLQGAEDPAP